MLALAPAWSQWRGAVGVLLCPPLGNSSARRRGFEPYLRERVVLALTALQEMAARVACLFRAGGPSTVCRGVPAIGVDSVNGQIFAVPRSYGPGMECIERDGPLVADLNSTAAVAGPADRVRVCASSLHPRPDAENPRAGHAVCRGAFLLGLLGQAPAGLRVVGAQPVPRNDALAPTVAKTTPSDIGLDVACSFKNQKSLEPTARQIDSSVSAHVQSVLGNDAKGGPKC